MTETLDVDMRHLSSDVADAFHHLDGRLVYGVDVGVELHLQLPVQLGTRSVDLFHSLDVLGYALSDTVVQLGYLHNERASHVCQLQSQPTDNPSMYNHIEYLIISRRTTVLRVADCCHTCHCCCSGCMLARNWNNISNAISKINRTLWSRHIHQRSPGRSSMLLIIQKNLPPS